jgi:hypothetical protein
MSDWRLGKRRRLAQVDLVGWRRATENGNAESQGLSPLFKYPKRVPPDNGRWQLRDSFHPAAGRC